MTYPNMDLQSLPRNMDLRVGTDPAERMLQLAYYQWFAGLQAVQGLIDGGQFPQRIIDGGDQAGFTTALGLLRDDMVAAGVHFTTIWAYTP